jgi:hypothetical protein
MPDITLEPGSPSERIALHLVNNPGAELTRTDVARLLNVALGAVDPALQAGTGLGLITCFNSGDAGRCWRAGPRLANWRQQGSTPAPAPAARTAPALVAGAAPAAAEPKKKRGGFGKRLPALQLSLLKVANDLPLPPSTGMCSKGHTKYDGQLDMLTADGMSLTGIHPSYKSALKKAIDTYLQSRPALAAKSVLVVRTVDDESIGVWRVAKGTPGTQKVGGRPARKAA